MGRHHVRLPDHLYLSPPQTPSTSSASSFLSFKSATYTSAALISETSSNALAVSDRIPGFKTSAAFLQSLRANLALSHPLGTAQSDAGSYLSTPPSSSTSTPDSLRPTNMTSSTGSLINLPPPSPSPLGQPPEFPPDSALASEQAPQNQDPLAGIPELTTRKTESEEEKIEALRLIADSVAQQRQLAASAILFHPITLSVIVGLLAIVIHFLYHGRNSDWAIVGTTGTGVVMAVLISIRWATSSYLEEAERVGTWAWLDGGREAAVGSDDDILLTRFGDEVIGAVVFRGVRDDADAPPALAANPKKARKQGGAAGARGNANVKGVIRAWTVKRRYRGRGVGTGLLEDVVKIVRERGWGGGVVVADDHANSMRIASLRGIFDGSFDRNDRRGRRCVERVLADSEKEKGDGRRRKR